MATQTVKPEKVPTLAEARERHASAQAEVTRLQQALTGRVSEWVTRSVVRPVVRSSGAVETVRQDEPVLEGRDVDAMERLAARRALPAAVDALEVAAIVLEAAEGRARAAERERAAAVIAEVDPEVRQRLAAILPIVERAAAAMADFKQFAEAADHRLGGFGGRWALLAFSALVSDIHAESQFSRWRRYLSDGGWLAP